MKKHQPMTAQDMARKRNKKYGSKWVRNNALKASAAAVAKRKKKSANAQSQ